MISKEIKLVKTNPKGSRAYILDRFKEIFKVTDEEIATVFNKGGNMIRVHMVDKKKYIFKYEGKDLWTLQRTDRI